MTGREGGRERESPSMSTGNCWRSCLLSWGTYNYFLCSSFLSIVIEPEGGGAAASYRCTSWVWDTHSKLRDINLHHVTHSLISRNLREQMFIVRISLLIVTFLSFISRSLVTIVKLSEKSNPTHSHCAMCQHGECHLLLLLLLLLIMPLVECWSRIHVNITKLHNITCTLIAAGVMLRSLMSVYIYISSWSWRLLETTNHWGGFMEYTTIE